MLLVVRCDEVDRRGISRGPGRFYSFATMSGDASRAVLTQEPVWFQVEMSRDIEGTGGCARWLSG